MALAVDTGHLLNEIIPVTEEIYNDELSRVDRSRGRRLQLHRVCVDATVIHDAANRDQFYDACGKGDPKQKAALEWQAEHGDDEDEVEVLHHLKQLAATTTKPGVGSSRPGSGGVQSRAGTTTLVASVQSPTFTSCTQHRPSSSFRRYSTRNIWEVTSPHDSICLGRNDITKFIPDFRVRTIWTGVPKIISTDAEARYHSVIWLVQLDFFDLSSHCPYSPSNPRKRRRTLNPFHHVSLTRDEGHTARAQDYPAPEAKRFKGVRYRPDHNRWVAEMKPPKGRNKVSFGEFRSQIDAARVVDVAFHHYGRPLNFPDSTPPLLSSQPSSAGLSAEATLEVVRNQTEWMKSRVSSLPSPSRSASDTNSGLRPFSAIGSSLILVGTDESDDAVSQPQSDWLQELVCSSGMAEGQGTWGVADGSGDGLQNSPTQWSVETVMTHDPSGDFGIRPEHFGGVLTTGEFSTDGFWWFDSGGCFRGALSVSVMESGGVSDGSCGLLLGAGNCSGRTRMSCSVSGLMLI